MARTRRKAAQADDLLDEQEGDYDDAYESDDYDEEEGGGYVTLDEIDPHDGLRGFARTPFVALLALSLIIHAAVIVGTSIPWFIQGDDADAVSEVFDSDDVRSTPAVKPPPETESQETTAQGDDAESDGEASEPELDEENEHIRSLQQSEPAPSDDEAADAASQDLDRLTLP